MADQQPLKFRVYDASGRAVRIKRRYLILVVLGIAAVAGAFLFIPFYVTTTPGFCSNCHLMEPFINSWEHSTHAKFGCDKCHVKPGLINHVVNSVVVSKNVYLNYIGKATMPAQIRSATNDELPADRLSHHQPQRVDVGRSHHPAQGARRDAQPPVQGLPLQRGAHADGRHAGARPWACAPCATTARRRPTTCTTCHKNPPTAAAEANHPTALVRPRRDRQGARERTASGATTPTPASAPRAAAMIPPSSRSSPTSNV